MIEQINNVPLSDIQQGLLFISCSTMSMLYHYIDRVLQGGARVLNNKENIWTALKIKIQLLLGSTAWASLYSLSNIEIMIAGITLGMMAYNKGISTLKDD